MNHRFINQRLTPGQDLRKELLALADHQELKASCLLSAVGSLTKAKLRLAEAGVGAPQFFESQGPFEIVGATGTLGSGGLHIHLAIANRQGQVIGGHLVEGNLIHTTCEIILLEQAEMDFQRSTDAQTGYKEWAPCQR